MNVRIFSVFSSWLVEEIFAIEVEFQYWYSEVDNHSGCFWLFLINLVHCLLMAFETLLSEDHLGIVPLSNINILRNIINLKFNKT